MNIGLSAGHGGRNRGTHHGTLYEPDLTLDVACRASALLSWSSLVEPVLIRQGDVHLTHEERAGIAARAGCGAVVEIHFNHNPDPSVGGGELYTHRGDVAGFELGREIFNVLPGREWVPKASDALWEGSVACPGALAVTKAYYDRGIPCALLELCYLSHSGDRYWLTEPGSFDKMAFSIFAGSEAWVKLIEERAHEQRS